MTGSGAVRGSPPITSEGAIQPACPHQPAWDRCEGSGRTPASRRYEQLVAGCDENGKALSTAVAFEIDDVIDPAQTGHVLIETLARTRS